MAVLQVFGPPMCCTRGVCGPNFNPALPRFAADLEWLRSQGVVVERSNLSNEPAAFAGNPVVQRALAVGGPNAYRQRRSAGGFVIDRPKEEELAKAVEGQKPSTAKAP